MKVVIEYRSGSGWFVNFLDINGCTLTSWWNPVKPTRKQICEYKKHTYLAYHYWKDHDSI